MEAPLLSSTLKEGYSARDLYSPHQTQSDLYTSDTTTNTARKPRNFSQHMEIDFSPAVANQVSAKTLKNTDMQQSNTKNQVRPRMEGFVPRRWASPIAMVIFFLLGVVLAIAHHFYYSWLDGQVVGSTIQQQWSLRIGNFFAIATAISLKFAMANACVQYIWLRLRQKRHRVGTIDAAFSITADVFSLFHASLYKDMHIGVVLAVMIWAIPIASLFPPATLSVVLDPNSTESTFEVLQPSILAPDPVNQYGRDPNETLSTAYTQPPEVFSTLVKSVAYNGEVTAPQALIGATNYSYVLDTYMPRIKCEESPGGLVGRALEVAQEFVFKTSENLTSFNKDNFTYVDVDASTHGVEGADDGMLLYLGFATLAGIKVDAQSLEITGLPESQAIIDSSSDDVFYSPVRDAISGSITIGMTTGPSQVKIINCGFYNASFKTETTFANNIGTTNVLSIEDTSEIRNVSLESQTPTSYLHYFQEMTKLFVGGMKVASTVIDYTVEDPVVVRMPYSSVGIESTVLATASDISDMLTYRADWIGDTEYKGRESQDKSLTEMLNELSVNVSLSLMSSSLLCRTVSMNGEIHTLSTIYQYQPMNLLISYGVAIACGIASIVVGFLAWHRNKDSHDTKFSTIGAMLQNPELAQFLRRPIDTSSEEDVRITRDVGLKLDTYTIPASENADLIDSGYANVKDRRYVGFVKESYKD